MQHQLNHLNTALKQTTAQEQASQTELETLQSKLKHAIEDPVTHLLGWQLFEDRLNQTLKESMRYHFTTGVVYVDIDNFRVINDGIGHEMGDILLCEMAERLKGCIRQVDSISRVSKDTFVVLLAQLAKPETAAIVAERMLQAIALPFYIKQEEFYLTVGVGIAIYPNDGDDAASLLRNAEHALNIAKQKDKHIYQFYQEKIHLNSQRELQLCNGLRRDSLVQELKLTYQPIMNIEKENLFCIDVSVTWQHPELGLIDTNELMSYAEKQQKINKVTEWLLRRACQQYKEWQEKGESPTLLGVPILLRQLESSQFIYRLSQILQEEKMNPEHLLFEIKDSGQLLSLDVLDKGLNMLQYLGVKLAINDFGANSLSLVQLKNIPVNYLKLDSSLIADIDTDVKTQELLKALTMLAKTLDRQIIMQGVTGIEQATLLKSLSCPLMAGSYITALAGISK